jgi:hypothetical protein
MCGRRHVCGARDLLKCIGVHNDAQEARGLQINPGAEISEQIAPIEFSKHGMRGGCCCSFARQFCIVRSAWVANFARRLQALSALRVCHDLAAMCSKSEEFSQAAAPPDFHDFAGTSNRAMVMNSANKPLNAPPAVYHDASAHSVGKCINKVVQCFLARSYVMTVVNTVTGVIRRVIVSGSQCNVRYGCINGSRQFAESE